eukprot:TRINITY_DN12309_c0_g1_i2.p5 TRINITY_DN12309_c0_g1~~TRINITY_DN12309_c0_g1_i2.p5  ORF type:complete len:106 (+),score=9.67 TRINITY_DN12309_c0_g1_i2:3180-3497(+)
MLNTAEEAHRIKLLYCKLRPIDSRIRHSSVYLPLMFFSASSTAATRVIPSTADFELAYTPILGPYNVETTLEVLMMMPPPDLTSKGTACWNEAITGRTLTLYKKS